jgi:tetratricopeptide (TPR) repeat protein
MRRATLTLALAAAIGSQCAAALGVCDSQEKNREFYAEVDTFAKALSEKRYADLDKRLNAVLDDVDAGRLNDNEASRWFGRLFSKHRLEDEPLHRDWVGAFPNSRAALLAMAFDYSGRGYAARSSKFAEDVSDSQVSAMIAEFKKALPLLDKVDALKGPLSLTESMRINMLSHAGELNAEQVRGRSRRAIKKFPRSIDIPATYAYKSTPKWGGSLEQLESVESSLEGLNEADRRYVHYLVMQYVADDAQIRKQYDEAGKFYEKSIEACPGLDGSLEQAMGMYERQKNYVALLAAAQKYIDRHPSNGLGYEKRGWCEFWGTPSRPEAALHDYEKAVSLGRGHSGLAWFYANGKGVKLDYARAAELYDVAAARGEKDAKAQADRMRGLMVQLPKK